ncbi:MAG: porin family protein [Tannerella sp.]|jgi:outer membrane protein X|nr:porin family protein [Tannerella sp.]
MKSVFRIVAICTVAVFTVSVTAGAQKKGDKAVGGNLVLGSGDNFTNHGIGAKFQYNVTTPLRLEGSFTYFLPKKQGVSGLAEATINMWDLSVNGHWLFPLSNNVKVYPLAGASLLGTSASAKVTVGDKGGSSKSSASEFGFNFGGGLDFKLTDNFVLNGELKYRLGSNWDRFLLSVGVAYRF